MKYRDSLRIVDPTLRDGGLVNDFRFTDEFVRALYRTNLAAGVDYMQVGYRASKAMFNPDDSRKAPSPSCAWPPTSTRCPSRSR